MKSQRDHPMRLFATVASCAAFLVLALAACSQHEDYVGPASMTQDQVAQLLTQQGYTGVAGLHKNGRDWIGSAYKGGHAVDFDIAPDGTVHTR